MQEMIQFQIILFRLAEAKNPPVSYNDVFRAVIQMGNVNTLSWLMNWTRSANCSEAWILNFYSRQICSSRSPCSGEKMFSFCCFCVGKMYIKTSGKYLNATGTKTWRKLVSDRFVILFQLRAKEHLSTWKKAAIMES